MASTEVKRALSFERRIIATREDEVQGWIEATLECGHLVQYCTPSVKFTVLHCGECVNDYLRKAREEQARQRAAEAGRPTLEQEAYPCMSLPPDQRCNRNGPGGFMGHTCTRISTDEENL